MTRYEELKSKQHAALIVVVTLGLAAVPVALNWESNIFEGTSIYQGPMQIVCKMVSFFFLTVLCAVPAFCIYLISLIITSIQLYNLH